MISVLNLVKINLDDELEKQVFAAYIFGMINGLGIENKVSPVDVHAEMIKILIDKFESSSDYAAQCAQFLIDSTDRSFHPTMFSIIHRGMDAYFMYQEKNSDKISDDFKSILTIVRESNSN
jgi:hypothetical protein